MNRVFLCEKPSQAADIARVLACGRRADGYLSDSDGTSVTWCIGHLLEQVPPEDYDPDLKTWRYETIPFIPTTWKHRVARRRGKTDAGYAKQLKVIRSLLSQADEVVIACDAGREGEAIGREVLDYVRYRGNIKRLWLSAFVDSAIRKAIANLQDGESTLPLYRAALARARADWVVGLNLTRLYTLMARDKHVDRLLSVGRVQSPTLSMVVARDRAIEGFTAEHYFVVVADCRENGNCQFSATWRPRDGAPYVDAKGRCTDSSTAHTLAQQLQGHFGRVAQCTVTPKRESPPLPFSLSTLQQTASARFGFKADATLKAAQALYEKHKLTTYPRTDSTHLSLELLEEVDATLHALVQTDAGLRPIVDQADPLLRSRAWNDSKVTDHHAIIPTTGVGRLASLNDAERRSYDLIRRRYMAQFFSAFVYDQISINVDFELSGATFSRERFLATGRRVTTRGWKVVVDESVDDAPAEPSLMPLQIGTAVQAASAKAEARETKPPKHYTDGTLIGAMSNVARSVDDAKLRKMLRDTSGLGTEATRASIMETLIARGFICRHSKRLISTPLGRALVDALPAPIKDPAMTALWEQSLDDIANGRLPYEQFLERQYTWLRQLIEHVNQTRHRYSAPLVNVPLDAAPRKRKRQRHGRRSQR